MAEPDPGSCCCSCTPSVGFIGVDSEVIPFMPLVITISPSSNSHRCSMGKGGSEGTHSPAEAQCTFLTSRDGPQPGELGKR